MKEAIILFALLAISLVGKSQEDKIILYPSQTSSGELSVCISTKSLTNQGIDNNTFSSVNHYNVSNFIGILNKAIKWGNINKIEKLEFSKELGAIPYSDIRQIVLDFHGKDDGSWYVKLTVNYLSSNLCYVIGYLDIYKGTINSLLITLKDFQKSKNPDEIFK